MKMKQKIIIMLITLKLDNNNHKSLINYIMNQKSEMSKNYN